MGDLVHHNFTTHKVDETVIALISCRDCGNKTFRLVHVEGEFPRCECAGCNKTIGKIGWVPDED